MVELACQKKKTKQIYTVGKTSLDKLLRTSFFWKATINTNFYEHTPKVGPNHSHKRAIWVAYGNMVQLPPLGLPPTNEAC